MLRACATALLVKLSTALVRILSASSAAAAAAVLLVVVVVSGDLSGGGGGLLRAAVVCLLDADGSCLSGTDVDIMDVPAVDFLLRVLTVCLTPFPLVEAALLPAADDTAAAAAVVVDFVI